MAWYNSSADAEKLGLTVRGFFTFGIITGLVVVLGFFGLDIDVADIESLLDSFQGALVAFASAVASIMVLYGVIRKFYYKIVKK